jgi:hypothetical protein
VEVFKADQAYFMDSVANPSGKISDGYNPQMPEGLAPDAGEREALLHYVVSLGAAEVVPTEPAPEGSPTDVAAPGAAPAPAPAAALAPRPTGANQ